MVDDRRLPPFKVAGSTTLVVVASTLLLLKKRVKRLPPATGSRVTTLCSNKTVTITATATQGDYDDELLTDATGAVS